MKLKPCSIEDIVNRVSYQSKCKAIVKEFIESGVDVAEVDCEGQRADSATASLRTTIRRLSVPIRAIRRGDRVFLMKERN